MSNDRILDRAGRIPGPPTREGYYWVAAQNRIDIVRFECGLGGAGFVCATWTDPRPTGLWCAITHHLPIPVPDGPEGNDNG